MSVMIKCSLTNGMLTRLLAIKRANERFGDVCVSIALSSRLRKSSKKKSSYASNKIEGNPFAEELVSSSGEKQMAAGRSFQSIREKSIFCYLLEKKITTVVSVNLARALKVSNGTVINWCVALV